MDSGSEHMYGETEVDDVQHAYREMDIEDVGTGRPARLPQSRVQAKARRITPYFAFTKEKRAVARAELLAAGESVSVGNMGKKLGQMWRDLSDEERAAYSNVEIQEPDDGKNASCPADEEEGDGTGQTAGGGKEKGEGSGLPLSKIKRIIKVDPDIKQVTAEAAVLIQAATEQFLQLLAQGSFEFAQSGKPKRSTIKFDDVARVVRTKRRFRDCIGEDLEVMKRQMEKDRGVNVGAEGGQARGGEAEEGREGLDDEWDGILFGGERKEKQIEKLAEIKRGKKPVKESTAKSKPLNANAAIGTRSITDFFKK